MKNQFCLLACMLLMQFAAKAQMKIGDNPTTINGASLLELESTNKGLVFPKVSLSSIASPSPLPAGLLIGTVVFNTNASVTNGNGVGLYLWNGSVWTSINTGSTSATAWSLTGNAGTNSSNNFIGTTDAVDFVLKTNNIERMRMLGSSGWVGIGTALPRSPMDINVNTANRNLISIQNTSNEGYSSVDMYDNIGNLVNSFGYANPGVPSFVAGKDYFYFYGKDFLVTDGAGINNYNLFLQASTGFIGINTNNPQQRFRVNGKFYLDSAFMPGGDAGTSGYVLTSSGASLAPTWKAATTLGSFSATAPLTYDNSTGIFAITQASGTANGYLSSADWTTFNNKVSSIALTTPSIFNSPVSFSVAAGAATGTLSLKTQTANTVFAGPVNGVAAAPGFRALVAADIPSLAGNYIQNQTALQASSNFNISGNGTIGTNLNVTGTSTLNGAVTSKAGIANTGIFTSAGGSANINVGSNFETNVNTGTSTSNINIGNSANNILFPKFNTSGGLFFTSAITGQIGNTATDMNWDNVNKRLGIGTITPAYKLQVLSASNPLYLGGVQPTAAFATDSVLTIFNGVVKKAPYSSLIGSFSATAPLTYNSTTGVFAINKATAVDDGYLSSADWNTFNNKVGGITLNTPSSIYNNPVTFSIIAGTATGTLSLNTQTANTFFAGPNGSAGTPSFRVLATADLPIATTTAVGGISVGSGLSVTAGGVLSTTNTGTVTSVGLSLPNIFTVSGSPVTTSGTLTGALNSQFANLVFASPSGTAGVPSFRALTSSDIPSGSGNYIQNQTTPQASSNFNISGNGTIGTNLNVTGTSTLTGAIASGAGITNTGILTSTGGTANINAGSNFATNINTGTSTGNVTIGNAANNVNLPKLSASSVVLTDAAKNLTSSTPSSNTYLYYNGTNFTWVVAPTLGSFSATLPLTYNSATGVFAINKAAAAADGYVSSTDWNIFNNKVGSITLNTPVSIFNNPVSFSVTAGAATGTLSLNTQTANTVFAGPVSGVAAAPGFRVLVAADIPSLAGNYIQNQTTVQASSNFNISGNGTIGTNLSVTGTSTLTGAVTSGAGITNTGVLTSSGGIANINAGSNFATNINTGTSTSNVTIGNSANNILFPKFNTVGGLIFTSAATGQLGNTATDMTWDDPNNRLGIGTTTPSNKLSVVGANPLYLYGVQATGTFTTDSILTILNGVVKKAPYSSLPSGGGSGWLTTGNSGTNSSTNFIGTTDAQSLVFKVGNLQAGFLGITGSSYATSFGLGASAVFQSTAIGAGAQATGSNASLAVGYLAVANKQNAISIGSSAIANFDESIAIGLRAAGGTFDGIAIGTDAAVSSQTKNIAIGYKAIASVDNGIAFGSNALASTNSIAMAIGVSAKASGYISNAFGYQAEASGQNTTAIGATSLASAYRSMAIGNVSQATADNSLAIGTLSIASAAGANAIGVGTTASGKNASAFGDNTVATGENAIAIGNEAQATKLNTIAFGYTTLATGVASTSIGSNAEASGLNSTTLGVNTIGSGENSIAIGYAAQATQKNSTAFGTNSQASAESSNAFGNSAVASALGTIAIGNSTTASGLNSTTLGDNAIASADYAMALGNSSQATKQNDIAFGYKASSTGRSSISVGDQAIASGNNSIALGYQTTTSASNSIAIGNGVTAGQANSLILGDNTVNVGIGTTTPLNKLHISGINPIYLNGVQQTSTFTTDSILTILNGVVKKAAYSSLPAANAWLVTGNGGTTAATNFIGTTDAQPIVFRTNTTEKMRLTSTGALLINTTTAAGSEVLNVNGSFKLGTSGTVLSNVIKGSVTVALPATTTLETRTVTATITGANQNATVIVNPRSALPSGVAIAYSYISAANTLTIGFITNALLSAGTNATFDVTVMQ